MTLGCILSLVVHLGLVFESAKEGWFASTMIVYNLWRLETGDIGQVWCLVCVNLPTHRYFSYFETSH